MRKFLMNSVALSALASTVSMACAAELGSLTVFSTVGEPLHAQLTVKDVDRTQSPKVRLAPATVYDRIGKSAVLPLSEISMRLESEAPYVVSITGKSAVEVRTFPLIVELSQGTDRSAKLYNITLKDRLPSADSAKQTAAAQKTAGNSKVPSAKGTIPSVHDTVQSSDKSVHVTQPIARERVASAKLAPEPRYTAPMPAATEPKVEKEVSKRAVAQVQKKVEPKVEAVREGLYPDSVDTRKPFKVQPGMTMWSIAKLFKADYPDATMDQLLVAFVRDNPDKFDKGHVNGVRVGSTLKAPRASTVRRVTVDESYALVRVNPNADARKAPRQKDLARAHERMKKTSPALYREVQARLNKEHQARQAAAAKHQEQLRAQREQREKEELAAKQAQNAASEASTKAENKPDATHNNKTEAKADVQSDPLAATIEATSRQDLTPPAAEKNPSVSANQTQPEVKAEVQPAAQPAKPAGETIVKSEPAEKSDMSTMLIALIVALVAAIGAAVVWLVNRNLARREADEAAMRTVRFMKAEPTTDEQLEGAGQMVEKRLEADRAAERGFEDYQKPAEAVKTEPVLEAVTAQPQVADSPAPEVKDAPSSFNVASAYVADEAADQAANAAQEQEMTTAVKKLAKAREYMAVGAYDQASRALQEVLLIGTVEEGDQARKLLAQIESEKSKA